MFIFTTVSSKESIIDPDLIGMKISPYLPLVSDPERSLTRRAKGGKEGFGLQCLYNYGLVSNNIHLSTHAKYLLLYFSNTLQY
jgi:hypothetical protein